MRLTENNLKEWKNQLDELMSDLHSVTQKYSDSLTDEEWIHKYYDYTPEEVEKETRHYLSQN